MSPRLRLRDNKTMIISSPFVIILSVEERQELTSRAHRARPLTATCSAPRSSWPPPTAGPMPRSRPISGCTSTPSANGVDASAERLAGLADRSRSGRPRRFSAVQVAEVKALACELPSTSAVPLAKWSCPDLATEAARRGVVASISASTVRRWLAADALKPWQHRSWIFPRDPDFGFKAGRVLDLYARFFDGQPLGADEYVLSADEKPGVQARVTDPSQLTASGHPDNRCWSNPSTAGTARWPTSPPTTSTTPR